jgi:hypothetical protein
MKFGETVAGAKDDIAGEEGDIKEEEYEFAGRLLLMLL